MIDEINICLKEHNTSNYKYEGYGLIRDLKTNILYDPDDTLDLLNGKDIHIRKLKEENQQLKQSQKQLAISVLLKVYQIVKYYNSEVNKFENHIDALNIEQYIDDQIKELKVKKKTKRKKREKSN